MLWADRRHPAGRPGARRGRPRHRRGRQPGLGRRDGACAAATCRPTRIRPTQPPRAARRQRPRRRSPTGRSTRVPAHWHPYVVEEIDGRRRFVQGRAADLSGPTAVLLPPPVSDLLVDPASGGTHPVHQIEPAAIPAGRPAARAPRDARPRHRRRARPVDPAAPPAAAHAARVRACASTSSSPCRRPEFRQVTTTRTVPLTSIL